MSSIQETSDLRNKVWAAGVSFGRSPMPILISPRRFENKTRTSNLGLRVDRCFIAAGYPNVLNKIDINLTYSDVREPGLIEHLSSLANVGQPVDVALFKQEQDFFDGDGIATTFYLQRRVIGPAFFAANTQVQVYDDYALRVTLYSGQFGTVGVTPTEIGSDHIIYKNSSTIDTGDPAVGYVWIEEGGHPVGDRLDTKVRFNTATVDAHDSLRITYLPLMRMLVDSDSGRTFQQNLQMGRSFKFTEQ